MSELDGFPTLAALGDELARAAVTVGSSRSSQRIARRPVLVAVALVLLLAATAAAGTLLVLRGAVIPAPAERIAGPAEFPIAGSSNVEQLRAPDPGHAPPWTIRVSQSTTGLTCTTVGQVVDGHFGLVGLDGRFRILAEGAVDGCGEVRPGSALLGARVFDGRGRADVRTVVAGDAGPTLVRVTVVADGHSRLVHMAADGTFATVLRGYPEDAALAVQLRFRDGRTETHDLGRDPSVVPDPLGAPAWSTQISELGQRPGSPARAYQLLCVQFRTAREQSRPAISPGACGMVTGIRSGGHTEDGLFFAIRRIAPDHRRFIRHFDQQLWNDHPARTAVWGFAGTDVRSITVIGPSGPRILRLAPGRTFLAVFPSRVDPARLHVRVLRANGSSQIYAHSHGLLPAPQEPQ